MTDTPLPRPSTPLEYALAYAARGWRVIPITPGHKYPAGKGRWQDRATTDVETIRNWWTQNPDYGVGIATGAHSGFFVVDLDVSHGKNGVGRWQQLCAEYDYSDEDVLMSVTGSGGRHLLYKMPVGMVITNSSGRLPDDIDIRGTGGQILVAPTIHPETGAQYSWDDDTDPFEGCMPHEAPEWLLDLITTQPVPTEPVAPRPKPAAPSSSGIQLTESGMKPGEVFTARHTWPEVLNRFGWRLAVTKGNGETWWTRPGKEVKDGHSATLNYMGNDTLVIQTDGIPDMPQRSTWTKFGLYAHYLHNGDHDAAKADLEAQGYVHERKSKPLPVEPLPDENFETEDFDPMDDEPFEWGEPVPFGGGPVELPPFPLEVFPSWMADHADAAARVIQLSPDATAVMGLGTLAAACAGRVKVVIDSGWQEHVNLYVTVSMPPSSGKSGAFNAMAAPYKRWERDLIEMMMEPAREYKQKLEQARGFVDDFRKKGDDDENAAARRRDLAELEANPVVVPKLTTTDASPETLIKIMMEQNGLIAIMSQEGEVFSMMAGESTSKLTRYVEYVKGFNGEEIQYDRKGEGLSGFVREAIMTICTTIQPHVLEKLSDARLRGTGLTPRFMFSIPPSTVGMRSYVNRYTEPVEVKQAYENHMYALCKRAYELGKHNPGMLRLTPEAVAMYDNYRDSLERRCGPVGELHEVVEWIGKLHFTIPRTAALLHVAHTGEFTGTVGVSAMQRALLVADYWLAHARYVYSIWDAPIAVSNGQKLARWIKEKDLESFTVRDVQRAPGRMDKSEIIPALETLIDGGWIRQANPNEKLTTLPSPGKASPVLLVHPDFAEHLSSKKTRPVALVAPVAHDTNPYKPNLDNLSISFSSPMEEPAPEVRDTCDKRDRFVDFDDDDPGV